MIDQYEEMRVKLMNQLDELDSWKSVQNALNKTLPNDSDETDYSKWLKGSEKFAKDNEVLLKSFLR